MALQERTTPVTRHARPEPRLTVRMYVTPTSGADVAFTSWSQYRYWVSTPEEAGLADAVETSHKRLGRHDGIPLEAE